MDSNMHQFHMEMSKELFEELKNVLPERGMIASIIRRFLQNYVRDMRGSGVLDHSPLDSASSKVSFDDLQRGVGYPVDPDYKGGVEDAT